MSGKDDNFLARWSRRKQVVREAEQVERAPETDPVEEGSATADLAGDDESEPLTEDLEPLPDIESLTGTSDISAFLRKGVPEALKKAALRRAWSLDPAIRDFASPAEYDWDFNTPGSMHEFGPAPVGASTRDFVSYSTGADAVPRPPAVIAPTELPPANAARAGPEPSPVTSPASGESETADNHHLTEPTQVAHGGTGAPDVPLKSAIPASESADHPSPDLEKARPPRHGGALPR